MFLYHLFNRQWWKTTLLVIVAVGVLVRLGNWQLDRLEQRRAFNTRAEAQLEQPVLELNKSTINEDLEKMEYRSVEVAGEYDHASQVVLRNQAWDNRLGVHILTPLRIVGTEEYILVNRGWVAFEDFTSGNLAEYNEPGEVKIHGIIRASQSKAEIGGRSDVLPEPGEKLAAWNLVNVPGIASQLPYTLLPVYIQQAPDPSWTSLPYRSLPELELTEGPHMGYAMQWFLFAAILGIGYPFYIRREEAAIAAKTLKHAPYIQQKSDEIPHQGE